MSARLGSRAMLRMLPLLLLPACDVFDESLRTRLEADAEAPYADAGVRGLPVALADFCSDVQALPTLAFDNDFHAVDSERLSDDLRDFASCSEGFLAGGADGFFRVELEREERVHFHVEAEVSHDQDLAVYVLSNCDARQCVRAVNDCPAGRDEHLTFVAPERGTYYVGVDGLTQGELGKVSVLASRALCGDGVKVHSEVCDDGNLETNDGCDDACRRVLESSGDSEVEPNGDLWGANVVSFAADNRAELSGRWSGPCDRDVYLLRLGAEQRVTVRMLDALGRACSAAPLDMQLLLHALDNPEGEPIAQASGAQPGCPVLTSGKLPWGQYLLSVRASAQAELSMDYRLAIELEDP